MPAKKTPDTKETSPLTPAQELKQLRHIVFGAAEDQLLSQLKELQKQLSDGLKNLNKELSNKLDSHQVATQQSLDDLADRLNSIDRQHDENEAALKSELEALNSEHDSLVASTQKEFKSMDEALGNEAQMLSDSIEKKVARLTQKLDSVSKELSSSKTDRKTLANLLATMATNLEDDDQK